MVKILMRRGSNSSAGRRGAVGIEPSIRALGAEYPPKGTVRRCLCPGDCARCDTTQQHNTHIRDIREICYPWHPWHGRAVRVHASFVKRGREVAYCSLEEVQTCRVLEVPLWMFDLATCCKSRVSKSGLASTQFLRELREVLQSAQAGARAHLTAQTQHRYLLHAGGADDDMADPAWRTAISDSLSCSELDTPRIVAHKESPFVRHDVA